MFTNLKEALKITSHIYFIVSREHPRLDFIPVDINHVFRVDFVRKVDNVVYNKLSRRYDNLYNLEQPMGISNIIVEDGQGGRKFLEDYFPNIPIVSAKGRGNIIDVIKPILKETKESILVVIDSLAFGFLFEDIVELRLFHPNVYTLTWKCFEEYILRSRNFNTYIEDKDVTEEDIREPQIIQSTTFLTSPEDDQHSEVKSFN